MAIIVWTECSATGRAAGAHALDPKKPICLHDSEECVLVNQWFLEGTAAGNRGDSYDNRDRGHSKLAAPRFPQLDVIQYTPGEQAQHLDWGGQTQILDRVTIGNSSTAASVRSGGSHARRYYLKESGLQFLYAQYRSSNLYVYPEHRDHDPGHNGLAGYGDVLPANSPYLVISQGSSGSDRAFVRAFVHTLAAFRPEVKTKLIETGLLMPTLQMLFRISNRHVQNPVAYLTGKAHPTVFEAKQLNPVKMVRAAHNIHLGDIPPMVHLRVISENLAEEGRDYFDVHRSEKLADTPAVIARIVRGSAFKRRIVVSAHRSGDINNRPLTYRWVVLRGDAQQIEINLRDGGAVAEIIIPYHARRAIADHSPMSSNRVDIGVFVHNGQAHSAPGFVTFYSLDNERRTYDDEGRIVEIHYDAHDASFEIFDWMALFSTMQAQTNDLPNSLLKKRFKAGEIAAIHKAGMTYGHAFARQMEIETQWKQAKGALEQAKASVTATAEKLKQIQAVSEKEGGTPLTQEVEEAQLTHAVAVEAAKKPRQALRAAQKKLDEAKKESQSIISSKYASLQGRSVKTRIRKELKTSIKDTTFYTGNAALIRAEAGGSSNQAAKQAFMKARGALIKLGILKKIGPDRFSLQSVRQEGRPVEGRLTGYERYQIERFHLIILTELLYPQFLKRREKQNYVDPHLTTPKPWRDVYHYDAQGVLTGRTRYGTAHIKEYTYRLGQWRTASSQRRTP